MFTKNHKIRNTGRTWFKKGDPRPKNAYSFPKGEKHPRWTKGRPLSEEAKAKISKAHKGRIFSEEHKKRISISKRGIKNAMWKGGKKRYFHLLANAVYREHNLNIVCEICGSPNKIAIHHKDQNYKNNSSKNLSALCSRCHKHIHMEGVNKNVTSSHCA